MSRHQRWGKKRKSGYRSGLEEEIADDLLRRGVDFKYEFEKLEYRRKVQSGICDDCAGNKVFQRRTYTPDFRIGEVIVESKGRLTATDRGKMLAVKKANPTLDIRFIFASNNKLNKGKDERYSDWADKNGFQYHVGRAVPEEWVGGGKPGIKRKRNNRKSKPGEDTVALATPNDPEGSS